MLSRGNVYIYFFGKICGWVIGVGGGIFINVWGSEEGGYLPLYATLGSSK